MKKSKINLTLINVFFLFVLLSCEKELAPGLEIVDCDKFQYMEKEYFIEDANEYGNDEMIITFPVMTFYSVEEIIEKTFISENNDTLCFEITFLNGCIEYVKPSNKNTN